MAHEYKQYRRKQIAELADWSPDTDMTGVSISDADLKNGSPKAGDKISRYPKNHQDRWLVANDYFNDNFEQAYADKLSHLTEGDFIQNIKQDMSDYLVHHLRT